MELLRAINRPPIFIFQDMYEGIICTSSKNSFQNPNLILKAYAIKEMAGSISLRYEKFLQKTMLVKKTGVLTKKRKGAWLSNNF
jgi:hypothetical protein